MKMFASDLDRTLIYSERALAEFQQADWMNLIGVEEKLGREVSYLTKNSAEALRSIAEQMLFVPVTTRTTEQYNRILIFPNQIPVMYAITANGANIIYKGKPLIEWRSVVQDRLKRECISLKEMQAKMKRIELKGTEKTAEELFFYYILEERLSLERVMFLKTIAQESGWKVSLQGRKLYFMPNPISKGEAVMFIKEREGISTVYGAGDSLLDHDFLKLCDFPYVPSHGELANHHVEDFGYMLTNKRGVLAGEEIVTNIVMNTSTMIG